MHIDIDGRRLTIEPIKVRDLPAFLAAVEPIAREFAAGDIVGALSKSADRIIEATRIGAGVDREWMDERSVDELAEIATAVLEVNAGFFVERVLPRLNAATETLARIASGGMNGSPGLSPPDSATMR